MAEGEQGALAGHLARSPDRPGVAAMLASRPTGRCGRVTRSERGGAEVLTTVGPDRVVADQPVCTGDWVVVGDASRQGGGSEVVALLDRRTALVRQAADGFSPQVLAANIDEVWIVTAIDRGVSSGRLERTAVLAWESGATPVVVATKIDLSDDTAPALADIRAAVPGADIVVVSGRTGEGMTDLVGRLTAGTTVALIGASGSGKSTLLNSVVGRPVEEVGAVRHSDGKGRHTTSWRHLELTDTDAAVIDTPGLRAVGLWVDSGGVDAAFADVVDVAAHCRFADCSHRSEPGCAIKAALADGTLDPGRLARWGRLQAEAEETERRATERSRAADARRLARRRASPREH